MWEVEEETKNTETKTWKGYKEEKDNGLQLEDRLKVSDFGILSENHMKTPIRQLGELLEGQTSSVCRDHPHITLCNYDTLQASADDAQDM